MQTLPAHNSTSQTQTNAPLSERRRRDRVAGETEGWILPAQPRMAMHLPEEEEAWEVRIYNVSRLGVGFTSTDAFELGSEHRLRIGRGPMKRSRLIRVVACRQDADGTYAVGAEFSDTPAKEILRAG
jgi:hypothetical protein